MMFETIMNGAYLEALHIDADGIWFSDVAMNGVRRRAPDGQVDLWLPDRALIGGLLRTEDGVVLATGSDGVAWFNPATGASGMLIDKVDGAQMCVNEMTPDGEGGIYFGTTDVVAVMQGRTPRPSGLYRLHADGRVTQVCGGLKFSNGIGLSPDGRRLYHCESFVGVFAYDLGADGAVAASAKLMDKYDCDGLAVDADGNVWVAGFQSNEVLCLRPDGAVARSVALPGEAATNIRFTGPDRRDVYVTTVTLASVRGLAKGVMPTEGSALHRARWDVAGRPVQLPRFRLG